MPCLRRVVSSIWMFTFPMLSNMISLMGSLYWHYVNTVFLTLVKSRIFEVKTFFWWGEKFHKLIHVQVLVFKEGLRDSQSRYGCRKEAVGTENIFIKEPSLIILLSIQNDPNVYQRWQEKKLCMFFDFHWWKDRGFFPLLILLTGIYLLL